LVRLSLFVQGFQHAFQLDLFLGHELANPVTLTGHLGDARSKQERAIAQIQQG
jgi:hypothetical protein